MNFEIPKGFRGLAKDAAKAWAEERGVSRRIRRLAAFWAYEEIITAVEPKERKCELKAQIAMEEDSSIRRILRYHLSFIRWYWRRYDDCGCDYCNDDCDCVCDCDLCYTKVEEANVQYIVLPANPV